MVSDAIAQWCIHGLVVSIVVALLALEISRIIMSMPNENSENPSGILELSGRQMQATMEVGCNIWMDAVIGHIFYHLNLQ